MFGVIVTDGGNTKGRTKVYKGDMHIQLLPLPVTFSEA